MPKKKAIRKGVTFKMRERQAMQLEQTKNWHWQKKGGSFNVHSWTIFTKDENCGRGEYAEELDVYASTQGEARKIAQTVLDRDYDEGLRIARVELNY